MGPTEGEWRTRLAEIRDGWGDTEFLDSLLAEWAPTEKDDPAFRAWFLAHMVELPASLSGIYHWVDDGAHALAMRETEQLVSSLHRVEEPERVLATILFTDIADSTTRTAELGDRAWKEAARTAPCARPGGVGAISRPGGRHRRRRFPRHVRRAGAGDPVRVWDQGPPELRRSRRPCRAAHGGVRGREREGGGNCRESGRTGCGPWRVLATSSSRALSGIWWQDRASRSRAAASTSSRAFPAPGRCTPSRLSEQLVPSVEGCRSARAEAIPSWWPRSRRDTGCSPARPPSRPSSP
jgi:hypothetical protein